ncbi:MAG TPA: hypothetical protein VD969_12680 [Symbiobacteriaceae bacterium]|nr:hypothetical protein [Symbiobacteriaceae bacterium]
MEKQFKLTKEQIRPLVTGLGGCIATDMITVQGFPVRFMYREQPATSDWPPEAVQRTASFISPG